MLTARWHDLELNNCATLREDNLWPSRMHCHPSKKNNAHQQHARRIPGPTNTSSKRSKTGTGIPLFAVCFRAPWLSPEERFPLAVSSAQCPRDAVDSSTLLSDQEMANRLKERGANLPHNGRAQLEAVFGCAWDGMS